MREFSVPASTREPSVVNAASWVFRNAERDPRRTAVRRREGERWVDLDSATVAADVLRVAKGLLADGIEAGDRVALMGPTSYEWMVADFAILAVGAVTVPVYETSSADQVDWILEDSGAVAVFAATAVHVDTVKSVVAGKPVREVYGIADGAFKGLAARGEKVTDADVTARRDAVRSDDLASLIYTSGTTGRPKGCELSHGNLVSEVDQATVLLEDFLNDDSSLLLFLPAAHVLGRVIQFGAIATGCALGHTSDIKNLVTLLESFKPTFVLSVPRVFEKVYNTAKQKAHADGKGKIFDLADRHAIAWSKALDTPSGPGLRLKAEHAVISKLVYSKILAALGGNCVAAVSGGAPLGERLGHFFRGVGVTVYEGFGLTETCAAITLNRPDAIKIGTVGQPLPGAMAKVADDGELLFKGPMVFRGYWHNDDATKEAFTDGWFHSGDIGEIDDDGFVRITGRKKEIIVTAGGKNVAPAVLEDRARAHWLVGQMLVVGDQQPFIAALVTVDPEAWPQWLAKNGHPADASVASLADDAGLRAELQTAIDEANKAVSHAEQIKKFVIVPEDWTEEGGQLTPSLKLKRNVVVKENAQEIAALYS